jgi:hypothetical protein
MQGKMLRQVLDKMMQHGTAQNARVQVCLPDGKFYDISSLRLIENKIIGHRESHRLVVNDARSKTPKLYEGSRIRELDACGLSLEPMLQGFPSILNYFLQLES